MVRKNIHSIEFCNVNFQLSSEASLFKDLSYSFPLNNIVWLRGASGSGKSVIMKMLSGLIVPTSGDYRLNNESVNEMSFEEFLPYRCNIGYSFDFGGLIHNRDILGNMLLATEYHNFEFGTPDQLVTRVMSYMQTFNLQKVAYQRPSSIVGGLRKAACVARAFMHEPELLLLDDPTTGLRGDTATQLKDLILIKRASGELKHVIIASEDTEFMKTLNPVIVEVVHGGLVSLNERGAA